MILLRSFAVLAWVLVIFNADAQVSNGEGFTPMEGVVIKGQANSESFDEKIRFSLKDWNPEKGPYPYYEVPSGNYFDEVPWKIISFKRVE